MYKVALLIGCLAIIAGAANTLSFSTGFSGADSKGKTTTSVEVVSPVPTPTASSTPTPKLIPTQTQADKIITPLNHNITVSAQAGQDAIGGRPAIAFDGTNFLAVWQDPRNSGTSSTDVYGTFVSRDGTVLNPSGIPIGTGPNSDFVPSVAFDGTNYLVIWVRDTTPGGGVTEIYGARVTPSGTVLDTSPVQITTGGDPKFRPISLAFDGTNYLITWRTGGDEIRGTRVSKSVIGQDGPNGFSIGRGFYPWVAFNGTNYLVVWHDHGANGLDIFGARIGKNGTVLPPGVITISSDLEDQDHASVASDGTDFLVSWHDWRGTNEYGNGSAYVARVSAAGVVLDNPTIKISDHALWQVPVLTVYDGSNYFVAWHVDNTANFRLSDVYGRRVSSTGAVLDIQPVPAATSVGHAFGPVMGYGADRYLIAWSGLCGVFDGSCVRGQMLQKVSAAPAANQYELAKKASSAKTVSTAQTASAWMLETSNTSLLLHNIWAFDESHVYVSTEADDGAVISYNGSSWSTLAHLPTARKFGLWGIGPQKIWGVGWCWNISNYDGSGVQETGCRDNGIGMGVWGSASNRIFTIGAFAENANIQSGIFQFDGTNWNKTLSGVTVDLWDIWGTASNNIYAVGEFGTILRYDGSNWTKQSNILTIQSLNAIWGSNPNDIFAVGDHGTIIHFDGASWTNQTSHTTENLYGVWGFHGSSVYAVGASGTILHYDGATWSPEGSGTTVVLSDVGGAGNTVRAVGDHGVILKKTEKDCVGAITPSNESVSANGGVGSISVSAANNCDWTAISNDSWIVITSGPMGAGNGTVNYSVSPNPESGSRVGTVTLAGQTFAVTQPAALPNTSISAVSGVGVYNGTATITGSLTSVSGPVANKVLNFSINGLAVCNGAGQPVCPATNASGVATLELLGLSAGTYPISVSFAGDAAFGPSNNTGTLTISKASATITLSNLTQTYDGTPKSATATTSPVGLDVVAISYSQSGVPVASPTNAGSYDILATLSNVNYEASNATSALTINKAGSTITLTVNDATYDGSPHGGSAIVTGAGGLNQSLTINYTGRNETLYSSTSAPTNAGDYTASASFSDANHITSSDSKNFQITKAPATITLGSLTQTYDGTGKTVTVFTTPSALTVAVSYSQDGRPVILPTSLGNYDVSATISDANYFGTATGILTIAPLLITFESSRALALDSVTFRRDPFPQTALHNFSMDQRTRIMIFTRYLGLKESDAPSIAVRAGNVPLNIERVGTLSEAPDISFIIVKLDGLPLGDVSLTFTFQGVTSNAGVITISP